MERRDFLKKSALLSAPLLLKGVPVLASSTLENHTLQLLATAAAKCDKVLVIVQMNGGNDGLNTIIPLDHWDHLVNARSNILMPENSVLPLNNNYTTGMHPAMPEMRNLYNNGKLMIVQGVSYPNPIYSHFRATDIWFTASDSNVVLDSGWLGRALDSIYPNYPATYPNADMPDPLAVQIGSSLPLSLQGSVINMGYSSPDPANLINVINGITDPAPNSDYGHEVAFLRLMKDQSNVYRTSIQNAYNVAQTHTTTYPANNALANQLKIVARLIGGGLKTPIYVVNHPNTHDTHESQVSAADKTLGTQATNLSILSQAIGAFQADLDSIGKADKVSGMTFSEFGRRIKSNSSLGTDHGTSAPVMIFGAALNTSQSAVVKTPNPIPGMIGTSPALPLHASVQNQVPMQFDFRQIYTTIMQDWLCMSETDADAVLNGSFAKLPIFKSSVNTESVSDGDGMTVFPNPVSNGIINVRFKDRLYTNVLVKLYDLSGELVYTNSLLVTNDYLSFTVDNLAARSVYVLQLNYNGSLHSRKLTVGD